MIRWAAANIVTMLWAARIQLRNNCQNSLQTVLEQNNQNSAHFTPLIPIDWLRFGLPLLGVGANVWVIARAHACCSWWKSPRLSSSPSQWRLWPLTITPTVKLRRTTKLLLHLNGGFNGSIWGCCCWYYRILTLLLFNSLLSTLREDPWNSSLVLRGLVWSVCTVICRQLTPRVRVKLLFFVKGCIG